MQKHELEIINHCTIVIQYLHDVFFFFFALATFSPTAWRSPARSVSIQCLHSKP
ncbi:hypothetical protein BDZ91DRAFT_741391 [Kalaharituber pfeilii]|nr:hypothetical protein BDZ91DRAFT_741391 [Kalaharituber pfeilii]